MQAEKKEDVKGRGMDGMVSVVRKERMVDKEKVEYMEKKTEQC